MRKPPRSRNGRGARVNVQSLSAPIGGLNARDPIAEMSPIDAIKLLNFFPTTTDVQLRGGNEAYATGVTGLVETLAVYNKADGTSKMFASDSNDIWDVSSSGAASAQSATVTDGRWQWLNFGDGTNFYLMMFNGVDSPLYYNGSTWTSITGASSPALTGLTTTNIVHANEYKSRLFFIEKDSLSFWYLPAAAAGGALTEFKLDSFVTKGGYLMWMATWSFDSGDGPDDAAVFMTSEGEVIIYRGTDPSTAANWVLTGVYQLGKPLGRRSFIKLAGDLLVITQNGVFPLSKALQRSDIDDTAAVTNKIENLFNQDAASYGANFGWQPVNYFLKSAMLFNVPVAEGGEHKQYVMNTTTRQWCEFDSWDGECFVVYNDELYFGANTKVQKAWAGTSDAGADIVAIGKTAFNNFGSNSQQKKINLFRPILQVNGDITFLTGFDIDFSDNPIVGTASYSVTSGATWDVSNWDESYWAAGLETVSQWSSPSPNVGYYVSGSIKVNTSDLEVHWVSVDYVYETGGVI